MGRTRWIPALLVLGCARGPGGATDPPRPTPPIGTDEPRAREQLVGPASGPASGPPTTSATEPTHDDPIATSEATIIRGDDPPPPPAGTIPTVHLPPTTVGPAYPPALVRRVIRPKIPEIRACYRVLLAATPDSHGRGQLRFTIGAEGHVVSADMEITGLRDEPFVACVLGVIRSLEFPTPPGGGELVVTYPLVFVASGDPAAGG